MLEASTKDEASSVSLSEITPEHRSIVTSRVQKLSSSAYPSSQMDIKAVAARTDIDTAYSKHNILQKHKLRGGSCVIGERHGTCNPWSLSRNSTRRWVVLEEIQLLSYLRGSEYGYRDSRGPRREIAYQSSYIVLKNMTRVRKAKTSRQRIALPPHYAKHKESPKATLPPSPLKFLHHQVHPLPQPTTQIT